MTAPFRISRPAQGVQAVSPSRDANFRYYLDRLFKMIPGEVVSLYLVGSGLIPEGQGIALVIWFLICLAGVVAIRSYGTADPDNNKPTQLAPVLISSVAFIIWVYSLGGPFEIFNLSVPWIGSLLILLWTFFLPIFYRGPLEA